MPWFMLPFLLFLIFATLPGCGKDKPLSVEITIPGNNSSEPGPQDPPYTNSIVFPSGLRLNLVQDPALSATYPAATDNPFGNTAQKHYHAVQYFIPLPQAPLSNQVSTNFRLSEYAAHVQQRGDTRAYIDAQIANHTQQIRSGLGRALFLNSAYRSPEHNHDVGGATFSRHIYGDAVDIDVDQTRSDANLRAQEIFNEARDAGVDFVLPLSETSVTVNGQSRVSWVHIDDRGF